MIKSAASASDRKTKIQESSGRGLGKRMLDFDLPGGSPGFQDFGLPGGCASSRLDHASQILFASGEDALAANLTTAFQKVMFRM